MRVATTTLLLSSTAAVLVGLTILHQVQDGLQQAAQRNALATLGSGLDLSAQQLGAAPNGPGSVGSTVIKTVDQLAAGGSGSESYGVYLTPDAADGGAAGVTAWLPGDLPKEPPVPASFLRAVQVQHVEAWVPTTYVLPGQPPQPALAVGAPVPSASADYDLYYIFPLGQQAGTLALVQRTVLFSGIALVLLLVGVAALVTRQVVRPVRQAAAIAERLASGRHRERMPVRGRDELASLGLSFNRMGEQVQSQITRLRELSRVQQRFVADVSHELRTPITTVRMAADVLHDARADLPADLGRATELLQAQLDRFEILLADLLEISRHDAGAAVLEAEPVDVASLVRRAIDAVEPVAIRRGCEIRFQAPDEPVIAEMDSRRIDRVLRNLLSNAVEHGAGKPVELALAGGPGSLAVTVRDHGPGLAPGEASLVFGRFWRADPARARATGGTGLGLSIALEDAHLHAGWLQAWGEPGRGCVFRLTLPWQARGVVTESPLPLEPEDSNSEPRGVAADGNDSAGSDSAALGVLSVQQP